MQGPRRAALRRTPQSATSGGTRRGPLTGRGLGAAPAPPPAAAPRPPRPRRPRQPPSAAVCWRRSTRRAQRGRRQARRRTGQAATRCGICPAAAAGPRGVGTGRPGSGERRSVGAQCAATRCTAREHVAAASRGHRRRFMPGNLTLQLSPPPPLPSPSPATAAAVPRRAYSLPRAARRRGRRAPARAEPPRGSAFQVIQGLDSAA